MKNTDHTDPYGNFGNATPATLSGTWGGTWAETKQAFKQESEAQRRKGQPLARGVLDYFPDALLAVAELSRVGNEQHNPGEPLHWAKEKSTDEADALLRHLIDRGTLDTDGIRHSTKVAWRALALLQRELEAGRLDTERRRVVQNEHNP
jgi:hypothetical protein